MSSIDRVVPKAPTQAAIQLIDLAFDPSNWKLAVLPLRFEKLDLALQVAYGMDFYCGGHEWAEEHDANGKMTYVVSSKGYYHYVGA